MEANMTDPLIEPPKPNLVERLAYSLGFAVAAYVTLGLIFALAVAQFIMRALDSKPNEELSAFTRRLAKYLGGVAAFVALASDEKPFPFGPFPGDQP
jgi:hypothetical protein